MTTEAEQGLRIEATPGAPLDEMIAYVVRLADVHNCKVVCEFNGVDIIGRPRRAYSTTEWFYHHELRKRQEGARSERLDALADELALATRSEIRTVLERIIP